MKYAGKHSLSGFMKAMMVVFMVLTVVILVFLPWVVEFYLKIDCILYRARDRSLLLIVLYPSGISSFLILNELRKMFISLENENPFVMTNVRAFHKMAVCTALVSAMMLVKVAFMNTLMTMATALVFVIITLFCLVLADIFKQAVIYKEDNDLTV